MSLLAAAAGLSPVVAGAGKATRLGRFVVSFERVSVAGGDTHSSAGIGKMHTVAATKGRTE